MKTRWLSRAVLALALAGLVCGCGGGSTNLPTAPAPIQVSAVIVTGWLTTLRVGETAQLTAVAAFSDGSSRDVSGEASWQSSNATVVAVSTGGAMAAVSAGTVEIRATFQGATGTLAVTVTAPPSTPPSGLACGVERWAVKTLSDPAATSVDFANVRQTTIRELNQFPTRCSGLPSSRTYAEEFRFFEIVGRVTYVRREDDRDYHVALEDLSDPSYSIVTEVADPMCSGAISSPYAGSMQVARDQLLSISSGQPGTLLGSIIRVRGVGFFDFNHGQRGRARNCMELHPLLSIAR